jgi:phenylpyruvate tautomerase PptA (4-oxalocrotonate tautomerase family)
MPLVRINLRRGRDITYREKIGLTVHEALVSVGVPKDDRFQVISEHETPNMVFDPAYLGILRTEDLVMIQITWNEGRTIEQKKALYKAIADGLADKLGLRREDVFVSLVEVTKENWSFGDGIAHMREPLATVPPGSSRAVR